MVFERKKSERQVPISAFYQFSKPNAIVVNPDRTCLLGWITRPSRSTERKSDQNGSFSRRKKIYKKNEKTCDDAVKHYLTAGFARNQGHAGSGLNLVVFFLGG